MNRDPRGYYAALHVTPDATTAEIQHAFRALMRLRHPDVEAAAPAGTGPGNNNGDEARRILESFAVLRDPRSRAEYDPAAAAAAAAAAASAEADRTTPGGREVPVRHHRLERPVLRVTPVRWERGPL
ncbi:DnaJ-class molecular chaperone [Pseudarthrobacter oxydans]|uniref:J domain-containing protein n=1 Tax=Pseudarthrobacter oxydans TaxID=1671 RepID=UPI002788047D|nr:J domain-containing protein [Pseudarthrobacter oxydans]MDP9984777.1 DnaJ-class molecular chaperone [Pseudarthrobacter oxydans]